MIVKKTLVLRQEKVGRVSTELVELRANRYRRAQRLALIQQPVSSNKKYAAQAYVLRFAPDT